MNGRFLASRFWFESRLGFGDCEIANRLLRAQTLTVSFKKPWNLLAETVVAARSTEPVSATNSKWWSLLADARTFFDENPPL
jgi:hypothetical protein